jgi:hypothetical protein
MERSIIRTPCKIPTRRPGQRLYRPVQSLLEEHLSDYRPLTHDYLFPFARPHFALKWQITMRCVPLHAPFLQYSTRIIFFSRFSKDVRTRAESSTALLEALSVSHLKQSGMKRAFGRPSVHSDVARLKLPGSCFQGTTRLLFDHEMASVACLWFTESKVVLLA